MAGAESATPQITHWGIAVGSTPRRYAPKYFPSARDSLLLTIPEELIINVPQPPFAGPFLPVTPSFERLFEMTSKFFGLLGHVRTRAIVFAILVILTGRNGLAKTEYPDIVEDPPLSPQEQLKKFHLPPGFEIQLVAAEPDVHKPMNFNFDAAGRLWFTGSVEYPYPKAENVKGRDLLRIIQGFNPDGSATKITTFADDLNIPIGVWPVNAKEAIVFSVPNIYRVRDEDGDGFAEKREIMFGPFGQRDTHGLNNNFVYGNDGWIYACHGYVNSSPVKGTDGQPIQLEGGNIYRFRPDGSHIEFFTHGQVNPFGLAFDP